MKRLCFSLLLLFFVAVPVTAQTHDSHASVNAVRALWEQITGYITQVAEETPEADYGYRPTESVRTIGEMIAHVAGAQNLMCAAALGDAPRSEDEIERATTTKADLVAALKASTAYCAKAYAQSDAALQAPAQLFGQQQTRFYAVTLNATHNGEHYGNLITYLRMQGIVPPSSRR